jgi:hypothetical protein
MISTGDLAVSVGFLAGAIFCSWHGIRGLRGGPLWVDASDDTDELRTHAVHGKGAFVLGVVYLATAAGCVAVILQMYV